MRCLISRTSTKSTWIRKKFLLFSLKTSTIHWKLASTHYCQWKEICSEWKSWYWIFASLPYKDQNRVWVQDLKTASREFVNVTSQFLETEKAPLDQSFNWNVWKERNCPKSYKKSYLSTRIQRVKIGDTFSEWEVARRGVPQGSVLGPIFFKVHINDLFYHITRANLNAYADDEQLYEVW